MRIIQILESASVGGMSTSSVATAPSKAGKMIRRQKPTDNALDSGKLFQETNTAEGVRDLGYDAQSLIMKLRRDVEEKRLQPTRQAVLSAARELAGDMDFAPELLVRQVLGQGVAEGELDEACWKDYKQIGMKKKGGKQVPNCVPKESAVAEVAPPGWEKTVKAMKKHDDIDNPYALAWSMKNKGYKSHKKESIKEGGVKEILMDLRTMSDEEFQSTYKMSKMQARSKLKEKPVEENKKGVRAVKHTVKPRNFVAKNAVQSGAGAHKDKKKAQKQGDTKHKNKEPAYESRLWAALDRRIIK
jgi:hypothetical protein